MTHISITSTKKQNSVHAIFKMLIYAEYILISSMKCHPVHYLSSVCQSTVHVTTTYNMENSPEPQDPSIRVGHNALYPLQGSRIQKQD